jgi:hypothetical protein
MSFKIACPNCSQRIEVTNEHAGTWISCPTCVTDFIVKRPPPIIEIDRPSENPPPEIQEASLAQINKENQEIRSEAFPSSNLRFEVITERKNAALGVLKAVGGVVLLIAVIVFLWTLVTAFLHGAVWVGEKSFPWLLNIYEIAMGICLLILPLLLFRAARAYVGIAYVFSSYIFGITTWFWSLLLAYDYWGWVGLIIGLFFIGVGVFPVALLACIFHGNWSAAGVLLLAGIMIFIVRGLGVYFTSISEKE